MKALLPLPGLLLLIATGSGFADQRLIMQLDERLNSTQRQQARQWIQTVTNALQTVYGELPVEKVRIRIRASLAAGEPVPWGEVKRNPPRVLLVINPRFGFDAILDDWTAFHEVSHLLVPYRGYGDIWFSEGLATYYQNIIRARAGLISEAGLWNLIVSGFKRGQKQDKWPHLDLAALSDDRFNNRAFMRIYWSGVLYWLDADIRLRQEGQSLDAVLLKLKRCCESMTLSADEIAHRLDQLSGQTIFVPLFERYRSSMAMPGFHELLHQLGVEQDLWEQQVSLDSGAPLAEIRRAIFRGS